MRSRGRKSGAELSTLMPELTRVERVRAPSWLDEAAVADFRGLVAAASADHFRTTDVALLARYAEVCLLARRALEAEDLATYLPLVRLQASLAVKLRLCPSTRGDPKTIARSKVFAGRHWEAEIDD
ncbi:MAG: hypothetical protein GEU95_00835 [Rhizobiales bacterium]|nr:hypothetical protein [Hyphomicrobiales bacterium]